jgi:hypothetical protein
VESSYEQGDEILTKKMKLGNLLILHQEKNQLDVDGFTL